MFIDFGPTRVGFIRPEALEESDGFAYLAPVKRLGEARHDAAERYAIFLDDTSEHRQRVMPGVRRAV